MSEDDLRALRTRLLKKHGEELMAEMKGIDPAFEDAVFVLIGLSTSNSGVPDKLTMVANVDIETVQKVLRLAGQQEVLDTKQAFERAN